MKIKKVFSALILATILGCPTSIWACNEKINYDENQIVNALNMRLSISNSCNVNVKVPANQTSDKKRTIYAYTYPKASEMLELVRDIMLRLNDNLTEDTMEEFKKLSVKYAHSINYDVAYNNDIAANLYIEAAIIDEYNTQNENEINDKLKSYRNHFHLNKNANSSVDAERKTKDYINALNITTILFKKLNDPASYEGKNAMLIAVDESHKFGITREYISPSVEFVNLSGLHCNSGELLKDIGDIGKLIKPMEMLIEQNDKMDEGQKELWRLQSQFNKGAANKMSTLEANVENVKERMQNVEERLSKHDEYINSMRKQLDSLDKYTDENTKYLKSIEARMNNKLDVADARKMIEEYVNEKSKSTDACMEALQKNIESIIKIMDALKKDSFELNAKLNKRMDEVTTNLFSRIDDIESDRKEFFRLAEEFKTFKMEYKDSVKNLKDEISRNVTIDAIKKIGDDRLKMQREYYSKLGWFKKKLFKFTNPDFYEDKEGK